MVHFGLCMYVWTTSTVSNGSSEHLQIKKFQRPTLDNTVTSCHCHHCRTLLRFLVCPSFFGYAKEANRLLNKNTGEKRLTRNENDLLRYK